MASAFDELTYADAEYVRKRFLAGDSMADIRRVLPGLSARQMRNLRDEVFDPLEADPEAVKELASGPVLNALEIVRYRRRPGRKPRAARSAPTQVEMFR